MATTTTTTTEPEQKAATKLVQDEVKAHFADPANAPLPSGVIINFGDPEPIRQAKE